MRDNPRQVVVRFVTYRKPNGSMKGALGRATLTVLEKDFVNNERLWTKLRDWCLGTEGVAIGNAKKTVTVDVLITDTMVGAEKQMED